MGMKKTIAYLLAAVIMLQYTVFADSGKAELYSEDFSSYENGYSASTVGSFSINKQQERLTVEEYSGNKYISVPSSTSEGQARKYSAAQYTGLFDGDGATALELTFEKKDGFVSGVRFYTHNSYKNYYELSFGTVNAYKVVESVSNNRTDLESSNVMTQLNSGMYKLDIMYSNEVIKWKISDAENGAYAGTENIGTDWHTHTVENPFNAVQTNFALIGGGGVEGGCRYTGIKVYSIPEIDDGSDWIFKYSDDFSSYTKEELSQTIGVWKSNGKKGSLDALSTELKITDNVYASVGKASMSVPATALYNEPASFTSAVLEKEIPAGGKQEIKVTFKTGAQLVTGVRFMVHNDDANYYEFQKNRSENSAPGWSLVKSVNNSRTILAHGINGKYLAGGDYTLKLTYDYSDYTGIINWELTCCDGSKVIYGDRTEVTDAVGSCEDLNPFKGIGTSKAELISGAQNALYSYFTDFSVKATESHEELPLDVNDPNSVAAYLTRQNTIIAAYNTAVENQSADDVKFFLTGSGRFVLARMDRINAYGLTELTDDEISELAQRLISYGGTVRFDSLEDIDAFEKRINTEIIVGKLCDVTEAASIITVADSNAALLGLDESQYYTSMKESIAERLINRTYRNAEDFKNSFDEAVIMANYKYTVNGEYFLGLLEAYGNKIGYNAAHFDTIDKLGAANAILLSDVKNTINSVSGIASWIDSYNMAPAPSPSVSPMPAPIISGGASGGGGGKSSFATLPRPTAEPETTDKNSPIVAAAQLYSDVPENHWAYEAIRFLNARKAVSGYEDGSFMPEGRITRAEFITMLAELYNLEMPADIPEENKKSFSDISADDWYYSSVMAAAYAGILSGDGNMAYPNREITRQEMAVLICKAMECKSFDINSDTELARFTDDDAIDKWAFASVKKLQSGGVISGNGGRFEPKNSAKRCEAAQILYMAVNAAERSVSSDEATE